MCWREMESRSGNKNTVNIQKQLIPIVDIFFDGLWGKTQISHCYRTLICTCVSLRNCGKCNFTNRGTCAHQQSINWSTNRQSEGWHLQLSSSQVSVLLRWCLWGLHHCGVESEHNVQVLTGGKKKCPQEILRWTVIHYLIPDRPPMWVKAYSNLPACSDVDKGAVKASEEYICISELFDLGHIQKVGEGIGQRRWDGHD